MTRDCGRAEQPKQGFLHHVTLLTEEADWAGDKDRTGRETTGCSGKQTEVQMGDGGRSSAQKATGSGSLGPAQQAAAAWIASS